MVSSITKLGGAPNADCHYILMFKGGNFSNLFTSTPPHRIPITVFSVFLPIPTPIGTLLLFEALRRLPTWSELTAEWNIILWMAMRVLLLLFGSQSLPFNCSFSPFHLPDNMWLPTTMLTRAQEDCLRSCYRFVISTSSHNQLLMIIIHQIMWVVRYYSDNCADSKSSVCACRRLVECKRLVDC